MDSPEEKFRRLYDDHLASVRRFFLRGGFSQDEAMDLSQETFLRAFQALQGKSAEGIDGSRLLGMARRVRINTLRHWSAQKRAARETLPYRESRGISVGDLLYATDRKEDELRKLRSDLLVVDDGLIRYLRNHPEKMRDLDPRKFEELIAELLDDLNYEVELTSHGADGGIDIFATQQSSIGKVLLIVECKRYSPGRRVGVGIVRALYGLSEIHKASKALLATTSFFTRPARAFERQVPYRLGLKDYDALVEWLRSSGH